MIKHKLSQIDSDFKKKKYIFFLNLQNQKLIISFCDGFLLFQLLLHVEIFKGLWDRRFLVLVNIKEFATESFISILYSKNPEILCKEARLE